MTMCVVFSTLIESYRVSYDNMSIYTKDIFWEKVMRRNAHVAVHLGIYMIKSVSSEMCLFYVNNSQYIMIVYKKYIDWLLFT